MASAAPITAASDNHDSRPGRSVRGDYPGGLAGIWAPTLTREAIWEALYSFRTYGTSIDRIYVEFEIEGEAMGADLTIDRPFEIEDHVIGKSDGVQVALIRDNVEIATFETTDALADIHVRRPAGTGRALLLPARHPGQRRACPVDTDPGEEGVLSPHGGGLADPEGR